jgi:hypothetical protein
MGQTAALCDGQTGRIPFITNAVMNGDGSIFQIVFCADTYPVNFLA